MELCDIEGTDLEEFLLDIKLFLEGIDSKTQEKVKIVIVMSLNFLGTLNTRSSNFLIQGSFLRPIAGLLCPIAFSLFVISEDCCRSSGS